ncbi:MAG: Ig-like domain-containing protein [Burkholderiales bacterium]|nr:Ig-like domain-containing protein [Burkholderiales bacterium]
MAEVVDVVEVTAASPVIARSTVVQLEATARLADGSVRSVTELVDWSSSDPAIARFADAATPGLMSAVGTGRVTLRAVLRGSGTAASVSLVVSDAGLVSLSLTSPGPSLPLGLAQTFTATGTFANGTTQDLTAAVTWSSSAPAVAAISNTTGSRGVATTLAPGSTTISALHPASGVTGSTGFTVTAAQLVSMAVTPPSPAAPPGLKRAFTATGTFTDGTTLDLTGAVTWSSSDTAVATISNAAGSRGVATTLATGSTTISATLPGSSVSGSTGFAVTPAQLVSLAVTPGNPSVPLGLSQAFTATGTFTDGTTQDLTAAVTWLSSAGAIASVSNAASRRGIATTFATGTTTITALHPASGVTASTPLTVTAAALASIAVTPSNTSVPLGLSQAFTAIGTYTNGTTQDLTSAVTWSSSSAAVATISNVAGSRGVTTTLAPGSTTITATLPGSSGSGSASFTVTPAQLVSLAVTPGNPSVPLGLSQAFAATGTFTDGSTQDLTSAVTWLSSAAAVATIGNAVGSRGVATTLAVGSTTITALHPASGIAASTPLTVTAAALASIAVTPSNASVPLGLSQAFTATGTYTNGTTQDLTIAVTWSSSAAAVAPISNAAGSRGVATALATGSTTINATFPGSGVSGSTGLTVTAAQLVSLAVTPSAASVPLGLSQAFTATGTYTNGTTQDLTAAVIWSSSAAAIATISNAAGSRGVATTLTAGSTTISALHPGSGVTASTSLAVSAAGLVSLAIVPGNPSVPLGLTQSFTATGTYTNGTMQDLTAAVTWSSSAAAVATISNAAGSRGVATALALGSASVTALHPASGVTATTSLAVVPWTPLALNPLLWLDAADPSTVTTTATGVSQWRDKSGNSRHAGQNTPTLQPAYVASAINGQPAVRFAPEGGGARDILAVSWAVTSSNLTVYVVFRKPGSSGNRAHWYGRLVSFWNTANGAANPGDFGNTNGWIAAMLAQEGGSVSFGVTLPAVATWRNSWTSPITAQPLTYGAPHIVGSTIGGTAVSLRLNGEQTTGTTSTTAMNANQMLIGGSPAGVDSELFGDIGEIFITTALATIDQQRVEGYLAWKWGLVGNLPAGHPFKSAPP